MSIALVANGIDCHLIGDGEGWMPVDVMFAGAPPAERAGAGRIRIPYRCLLVRAPGGLVLVDTGLGPYGGRLSAATAARWRPRWRPRGSSPAT